MSRYAYFGKTYLEDPHTKEGIGLALGYDHCAEHEWGIPKLLTLLGQDEPSQAPGLDARKLPPAASSPYVFFKKFILRVVLPNGSKHATKTVHAARLQISAEVAEPAESNWSHGRLVERLATPSLPFKVTTPEQAKLLEAIELQDLGSSAGQLMQPTWSGRCLGVTVFGGPLSLMLETFHEALMEGHAVMSVDKTLFGQPGLCLVDTRLCSQQLRETILQRDQERAALTQEFAASGIEQLLQANGKKYWSLAPVRQADGSVGYRLTGPQDNWAKPGTYTLQELQRLATGSEL